MFVYEIPLEYHYPTKGYYVYIVYYIVYPGIPFLPLGQPAGRGIAIIAVVRTYVRPYVSAITFEEMVES